MKRLLLFVLYASFFVCINANAHAAANVTISSVAVPAANMAQGTGTNVIYIAKLDVATENVNLTNVVVNLTGTYDNNDLGVVQFYYNTSAPSLTGAAFGGSTLGNFAGPHVFTIPTGVTINAGSTVYILITVNTNTNATDNHTVIINGATDPITIQATTAPNIINNQTNASGAQTIQASDITFTSIAVPAANIAQGTSTNIVYIAKLDVTTENVNMTNVVANLTGTYDNNDLSVVQFYYNTSAPSLTGAAFGGSTLANFAGPHVFTIPTGVTINAGSTVYILITVNTNTNATDNHTVIINGATDPITIQATTAPNIINNQTNAAGAQTIQAADVAISSVAVPSNNLVPGSSLNVIYIAKMDVGGQPLQITGIVANLTGTYDNDDLGVVQFYYNTSAPSLTGAAFGGSTLANFASPHTFTITTGLTVNPGTTVYILITVNVNSGATINNTVNIDGAINPISILASTAPVIANNQTNAAGTFNISTVSTLPLKLSSFTAKKTAGLNQVKLDWTTASEINTKNFDVQWSTDGLSYLAAGSVAAQGNSQANTQYTFTHTTPANGINYYRLKMIDIDGVFSFSPVVSVQISNSARSIIIAPNPVTTQLRLVVNYTETIKMLRIYDTNGRIIWQAANLPNTTIIIVPFEAFSNGLYNIEVTTQNNVQTLPFIKAGK